MLCLASVCTPRCSRNGRKDGDGCLQASSKMENQCKLVLFLPMRSTNTTRTAMMFQDALQNSDPDYIWSSDKWDMFNLIKSNHFWVHFLVFCQWFWWSNGIHKFRKGDVELRNAIAPARAVVDVDKLSFGQFDVPVTWPVHHEQDDHLELSPSDGQVLMHQGWWFNTKS